MIYSSENFCVLLLFSVLGASHDATVVSPGGKLTGPRTVISFAEHQTTEDRRAYLQGVQEQGYTCWTFPKKLEAAVCIQVIQMFLSVWCFLSSPTENAGVDSMYIDY